MAAKDCDRVVLVVDDDADIRTTIAEVLTDEGYEVRTASDGSVALNLLRAAGDARPCVILLDLMMPVMNGTEFYSEQCRDPSLSAIPVVVISAQGNLAEKVVGMGCSSYLPKPLHVDELLDVVGRYCS